MSNNNGFGALIDQLKGDISKKRVLLLVDDFADYDTVSALVGFNKVLQKLGAGKVDIAFTNTPTGKSKKVLDKNEVKYLTSLKKPEFIIKIKYADSEGAEIDDLKWEVDQDTVSFHVVPLKGKFDLDRVTIEQVGALYDVTILFNIISKDQVGDLFTSNQYLFENLKLTVLTNKDSVDFGNNVISNDGEALSELVYRISENLLDKNEDATVKLVGDVLLEGMLSYTEIMQGVDTPLNTFDRINTLVQKGCNIKNAWRNIYVYDDPRYVGIINTMYSNLKNDDDAGVIWSKLTKSNITDSGIAWEDFDVGGKLPFNAVTGYKMAFILYEGSDSSVYGILEVNDSKSNATEVLGEYLIRGNKSRASFVVKGKSLGEAENTILDLLNVHGGKSANTENHGDDESNEREDNSKGETHEVRPLKVVKEQSEDDEKENNDKEPILPPPVMEE